MIIRTSNVARIEVMFTCFLKSASGVHAGEHEAGERVAVDLDVVISWVNR